MTASQIIALAIFVAVIGVIVSEKLHRAACALIGAMLLILIGILEPKEALGFIDFNTIGVLIGMMMFVAVVKNSGIFEYLAVKAARVAKGNPWRIMVYFMIIIALVSWYMLRKTVFGRYIYAVGGNATASEISGINVRLCSIMCYVLSGLTTALGGIVLASMTQQASSSTGAGYTNDVITAGVIGGVSLLGGVGTVPGAIFGAVLMGLLNNGLNLMSVPSTHAGLVKGLVIVVAVAFDALQHADQSRKKVKKVVKKADKAA